MSQNAASFLKAKLEEIKKKNPRFSMRSLANKVGISPGRMSEILNSKSQLSEFYAEKIIHGLELSASERKVLWDMVAVRSSKIYEKHRMTEEEIAQLTSWENFAILNLMKTDDFQSDVTWIASRLAISPQVVKTRIQLLLNLQMIEWADGTLVRAHARLTSSQDIPSKALRKAHRDSILNSLEVYEKISLSDRDFTSLMMPVDPKKLAAAKKHIADFRNKMSLLMETDSKSEVYCLNIQLFPVSVLRNPSK